MVKVGGGTMAHHHKSNKAVEGNPDSGHGRGMPQRPDEDELVELTEEDRSDVGLPVDRTASGRRSGRRGRSGPGGSRDGG